MDDDVYCRIQKAIRTYKGVNGQCFSTIKPQFPEINDRTLTSMIALFYRDKYKKNHYSMQNHAKSIYREYMSIAERCYSPKASIMCDLSVKYDTSPMAIAKIIAEKHYANEISDPAKLKPFVTKVLKDVSLIDDEILAFEVHKCLYMDSMTGAVDDCVATSSGATYERHLQHLLNERGISFRSEENLRNGEFDKTPDIKLDVPVAIDGFVINWIESKALFGQASNHREYSNNQYLSYWNRFGPGLVIYWFGYLASIRELNEKRFIIRDCLPDNITTMNPLSIEQL